MRTLRIALRGLLRRPSFTVVAVLTLALGFGATAAMFAVVNGVVLEPLPYPDSERLVRVEHPVPELDPEWVWGLSEAGWWALREGSEVLEEIGVYTSTEQGLASDESAAPVEVGVVTANVLDLIGAVPVVGRALRWADSEPGAPAVAVLGHGLWQARFAGDPGVVGTTVRLEGEAVEVVGVLGAGSRLPLASPEIWLPLTVSRDRRPVNSHWMSAIGRLRPGSTASEAEAELRGIVERFPETLPEAYYAGFVERTGFDVRVVPLRDHVVGDLAGMLWVLLGAVGLVLLIGFANVTNLVLVRLEASRRERGVRTALGAGWLDIARGTLAEGGVLAVAAGVGGLALASWGLGALVHLAPDLPRIDEVGVGWEVVGLTAALAVVVAAVLGLVSARRGTASLESLREGVGLTASRRGRLVRSGLVVAEIALALVVVAGAALMLRTFQNLRAVDPGFEPKGVLTVQVSLPAGGYRGEAEVADFYRRLTDGVSALPGVAAVGATQSLPLASGIGCALVFVDDAAARERVSDCFASPARVTPGYFAAMGIAVEGEEPGWEDVLARRGGVVVSRPLAERVWPGEGVAGQGIKGNGGEPPFYRVVGIAEPVRAEAVDEPAVPQVYFPMLALEGAGLWGAPRSMSLVVKSAGPAPAALAGPIQTMIREMDPTVAVGDIRPMTEVVSASTARTSFVMLLLVTAAAVALALGVIGLYGVVSYVVEQRRQEIGIRMALGAGRGAVRRMVLFQAGWLAVAGVVVGALVSGLSNRALESQLFEVAPADPWVLGTASALLVAVALAGALVPARRASKVDPMRVLRGE